MKNLIDVSIVVPVHNEVGNIYKLVSELGIFLKNINYEIIFVDDGSTDKTLEKIKNISVSNDKVKYISLSRNFGHQSALRAGIDQAFGKCVVTMDGDLQHPPGLVPVMFDWWKKGFEIVYTVRDDKGGGKFKKLTAVLFYRIINILSDIEVKNGSADFRLIDAKVAKVIRRSKEGALFFRGYISWMGFRQKELVYLPNRRYSGTPAYSLGKMWKLAISGITSFSIKPLQISTYLGFLLSLLSGIYAVYALVAHFLTSKTISGWTSVIISVLFLGGIQLLILGIIGEYLGILFLETKRRPTYIVSESKL